MFARWLDGLRDLLARAKVQTPCRENPVDIRPLGAGVPRTADRDGPGCQVYFKISGSEVIIYRQEATSAYSALSGERNPDFKHDS